MTQAPGPGEAPPLDLAARAQLDRYLEELGRWAARTNLVGSADRGALETHVADSLAAAPQLPNGARLVDLGSGAGFPGVPLAIARPDLEVTLVEIRERRAHFLRHVIRTLGLKVAVARVRIEEPLAEPFEFALVRAVGPPRAVLPKARLWLGASGEIWLWTREDASSLGIAGASELPLGDRGRILRVPAAAVSRGTPG